MFPVAIKISLQDLPGFVLSPGPSATVTLIVVTSPQLPLIVRGIVPLTEGFPDAVNVTVMFCVPGVATVPEAVKVMPDPDACKV
ncbi:hypothetical protein D3C86_1975260 [compost metagenome]